MSSGNRIVVIGASAGGVEALMTLFESLPADWTIPVFVVQHLAPNYVSTLPEILARTCGLHFGFPKDGDTIRQRHVYIAPPDHHMLVEHGHIVVSRGPKENRFRPSVDALFRSAAYFYGAGVIGIVLSGSLDDGTSGLWTVKRLHGVAIVQDPHEAAFDSMPASALSQVEVDYCVPLREMGALLQRLSEASAVSADTMNEAVEDRLRLEHEIAKGGDALKSGLMNAGDLTPFTCPECHGVLVSLREGKSARFRCHTGHAYSRNALLAAVMDRIDDYYWQVIRSLEEAAMILEEARADLLALGNDAAASVFSKQMETAQQHSRDIRRAIMRRERISVDSLLRSTEMKQWTETADAYTRTAGQERDGPPKNA